jgi:hypothetical protein
MDDADRRAAQENGLVPRPRTAEESVFERSRQMRQEMYGK